MCKLGDELREQVAYLRSEYESVGDQLEQEQSRSIQVTRAGHNMICTPLSLSQSLALMDNFPAQSSEVCLLVMKALSGTVRS